MSNSPSRALPACRMRQDAKAAEQEGVALPRSRLFTFVASVCCGILAASLLWQSIRGRPSDLLPAVLTAGTRIGIRRAGRRSDPPAGSDPGVRCASYARYSSNLQREASIADQRRKCHERAAANGHTIAPELEFSDQAVSGTKRHREGLDAMLAAAEARKFEVLYFHSLSRLSRESVITLPLLKHLVYNLGVRVICVTEGIDSQVSTWEMMAHVMAIVHEQELKALAANVIRGQEGAVLGGFSVGDYCFGYTSVPMPGSEASRGGRGAKPRKMYIVDPETAAWVERIFKWFVEERRSLRWIARELNRLGAPKDHRSDTPLWRHQYLPRLLSNRKYIGQWVWGNKKNARDPITGKRRQRDRAATEGEPLTRHFPHLQLIGDETFAAAQRLLEQNKATFAEPRKAKGQLAGSNRGAAAQHPRHLLSQLVRCGECGRMLSVGGANGKYLFCPGYAMGSCSCKTQLQRQRAERMILEQIGQRVLGSPPWRQRVLEELAKAWRIAESHVPQELAATERSLAEVERKIANLVDQIENGEAPPELGQRLAQRRTERQELEDRLQRLRRADQLRRPAPTEAWVDEQLGNLAELLRGPTPAACHALRDLVGGEIVVEEIRQPDRERHYLQGRFRIKAKAVVTALVGPADPLCPEAETASDDVGEEVVIEFREPPELVALADKAKALYDQRLMSAQIAVELGVARSYVTKLLKYWFESRGLKMPDGRGRRSTLVQKHLEPPPYQAIADEVMAHHQNGVLLQDIAKRMSCDRNTITAAVRHWHQVRGLKVPDGRARRKTLAVKTSPAEGNVASAPADTQPEDGGEEEAGGLLPGAASAECPSTP